MDQVNRHNDFDDMFVMGFIIIICALFLIPAIYLLAVFASIKRKRNRSLKPNIYALGLSVVFAIITLAINHYCYSTRAYFLYHHIKIPLYFFGTLFSANAVLLLAFVALKPIWAKMLMSNVNSNQRLEIY
jgi:heme A synthase